MTHPEPNKRPPMPMLPVRCIRTSRCLLRVADAANLGRAIRAPRSSRRSGNGIHRDSMAESALPSEPLPGTENRESPRTWPARLPPKLRVVRRTSFCGVANHAIGIPYVVPRSKKMRLVTFAWTTPRPTGCTFASSGACTCVRSRFLGSGSHVVSRRASGSRKRARSIGRSIAPAPAPPFRPAR